MGVEWTVLASAGSALVGVLLTALAHRRARHHELKSAGRDDGALRADLGYLKNGVDEIRNEQREQNKTNIEILTRLAKVEGAASQAHRRLDSLEGSRPRS